MFNTPTATSRPLVLRRATHRARGESAALPRTAAGGSFRRRLSTGALTPTATTAQAIVLMPLLVSKERPVYVRGRFTTRPLGYPLHLPTPRSPRPPGPRLDRIPRPCDPT